MKDSKFNWIESQTKNSDIVSEYLISHNLSTKLEPLLSKYNFSDSDSLHNFLHPNIENLYDPYLMSDMDKCVRRIKQAILNHENILIYGDYDCDGITSTTVLKEAIEMLGGEPKYYIPNRFTDGYGPNIDVYKYFIESGIDLIVTVDNGISGVEAIDYANQCGIDVIVTDHHELKDTLPKAYAIVHPRHPDFNYPFPDLAGVGVAFKVATALLGYLPTELLDLVAIGTIADLVSLTDENRILVSHGLKSLSNTDRIGLQSLAKVSQFNLNEITSEMVSFQISPRLNALGRLEDANEGVLLLSTFDDEEASNIAHKIDRLNNERKKIVDQITLEALAQLNGNHDNLKIVYGKDWHEGVLGIVASRLVEETNRPCIVLSYNTQEQMLKGSGRSIEAINLSSLLNQCSDNLNSYGGHHMAVGLSLDYDKLISFKAESNNLVNELLSEVKCLKSSIQVDQTISIDDITEEFIKDLSLLEPYGNGNLKPVFKIENPKIFNIQMIGKTKQHLKAKLQSNNLDMLAFNFTDSKRSLFSSHQISIVGELSLNIWKDKVSKQILIKDYCISGLQIFDGRNQHFMQEDYMTESSEFVYFNSKNEQIFQRLLKDIPLTHIDDLKIEKSQYVLLDQPQKIEDLTKVLTKIGDRRVVIVFNEPNIVDYVPNREDFKKLFMFINQYPKYDIRHNLQNVVSYLQLNVSIVIMMIKIFEELNFININDGIMIKMNNPNKQSLENSFILKEYKQNLEKYHYLMQISIEDIFKLLNN